jgi:DNA repair protein RadC
MNPLEVQPAVKPLYHRQPYEFRAQRLRDLPIDSPECACPEQAIPFLQAAMAGAAWHNPEVEQLVAVSLSTRRRVTGFWLVSQGTIDTVLVHAREVFRTAILVNAASIILAHNHPSGDASPSEADIKVTRDMVRVGAVIKIEVADHIILGQPGYGGQPGNRGWVSLRELGYLNL